MAVLIFFGASEIWAADNLIPKGNVTEYSVIIKKVELCTTPDDVTITSCATPLFAGNSGFINLASVAANQDLLNLTAGQIPSLGTYNRIRSTVSNTVRMTTQFTSAGTTFFTNAATTFPGVPHTVANTNTTGANAVTTVTDFGPAPGLNQTLYGAQAANGEYRDATGDVVHITTPTMPIQVFGVCIEGGGCTVASNVTNVTIILDVDNKLVFNDDIPAARYFRAGVPGVTVQIK